MEPNLTSPEEKANEQVEQEVMPQASTPEEIEKTEEITVEKAAPATKEELIESLKAILEKDGEEIKREDVSRIKQAFASIRHREIEDEKAAFIEGGGLEEDFIAAIDPLEQQLIVLSGDIKQKKSAWVEERDKTLKANLEQKESIVEAIEALANDTDNVNRSFTRFKELTQQFRETGDVPQENSTQIWKRFLDAEQHYYDQLKINQELRDYDFKKNLEIKEELIEKAEALAAIFIIELPEIDEETEKEENTEKDTAETESAKEESVEKAEPAVKSEAAADSEEKKVDIVAAFRQLQDLHDRWKLTGPVAKELREDLWQRFRNATVKINKVYQSFFEERKANEKANESAKIALCEKVESIDIDQIKTAKEWEKLTKEVIELQKQWKDTGFTSRKTNNALYSRFRTKCDEFFKKKGEFFSNLKEQQSENLRRKTELAERAEQLQESTDWNAAAAELTKLQAEWKTIGAIPRKQSDQLWERFHSACDKFFNRRKETQSKTKNQERENLKLKEAIVEEINALSNITDIDEVKEKFADLQSRWKEVGFVPFKDKNRISDSYRDAVNNVRKLFNLNDTRASFERFRNNVDDISGDSGKLNRERERLFRALENKRADLANYLNNMGFLSSKSKSGEGLLKEIEHKIELIKSDIADLEQKITLIDSKL